MRLYGISQEDVQQVMENPDRGPDSEGDRFAVSKLLGMRFSGMPLKVIYVLEGDRIVVLSAYPLKRSYRR